MWSVVDNSKLTDDEVPGVELPPHQSDSDTDIIDSPDVREDDSPWQERPPRHNRGMRGRARENEPNRPDDEWEDNSTELGDDIPSNDSPVKRRRHASVRRPKREILRRMQNTGIVTGVAILAVTAGFAFGAKFVRDGISYGFSQMGMTSTYESGQIDGGTHVRDSGDNEEKEKEKGKATSSEKTVTVQDLYSETEAKSDKEKEKAAQDKVAKDKVAQEAKKDREATENKQPKETAKQEVEQPQPVAVAEPATSVNDDISEPTVNNETPAPVTPAKESTQQVAPQVASSNTPKESTPKEPTAYFISFDANGGSCGQSSKKVSSGSPLGSLPTPTRDYHSFSGWFCDGVAVNAETVLPSTSSCSLVAHWTEKAVSGWVKASNMPSGGQVTNRKWTYTKTYYKQVPSSYTYYRYCSYYDGIWQQDSCPINGTSCYHEITIASPMRACPNFFPDQGGRAGELHGPYGSCGHKREGQSYWWPLRTNYTNVVDRTESRESSSQPSGSNISNIVEWVTYRPK